MNLIQRALAVLTGLSGTVLTLAISAPGALAVPPPPQPAAPGPGKIQTVATGGMPGWQITLIAVGAALLAATLAVVLDRTWAKRQHAARPAT